MSVLKNNRGEPASAAYVDMANQIRILIIKRVSKVSQKFNSSILYPLYNTLADFTDACAAANSIYISNEKDTSLRYEYLLKASALLQSIVNNLSILAECLATEEKQKMSYKDIDALIKKELNLLN